MPQEPANRDSPVSRSAALQQPLLSPQRSTPFKRCPAPRLIYLGSQGVSLFIARSAAIAMQALYAYNAGMKRRHPTAGRQYTIRSVPLRIDQALRHYAQSHGKSINQAAVDILATGLGLSDQKIRHHDLDFMANTWNEDSDFDAAIAAQDQVDPEMWR